MRTREPIFNVPAVVMAVAFILIAMHAGREWLLDQRDGLWMVYALGFVPARYSEYGGLLPGWPWAAVVSPLTHLLVHGDWVHLGINLAWLLAVGSPLARRMGNLRFLLYGLACGAAGALLFLLLNPGLDVPVVGASGGISGLMGGMFRLMFSGYDIHDRIQLRDRPELAPKLDLPEFVRERRALIAMAAFIGINLLLAFGLPGMGATESGGIAWEAHIGGFLAGVFAFDWFDPPRRRPADHVPAEPWNIPPQS